MKKPGVVIKDYYEHGKHDSPSELQLLKRRTSVIQKDPSFVKNRAASGSPDQTVARLSHETKLYTQQMKHQILRFMGSPFMICVIIFMTSYALFAEDFRLLACPPEADIGFKIMHIICAAYFAAELVIYVFAENGYLWSTYFWLDVLSFLSVIIDIFVVFEVDSRYTLLQSYDEFRAAKAAKIATRISRIIRALRMLTNMKRMGQNKEGGMDDEELEALNKDLFGDHEEDHILHPESKIKFGTYIQDLLTKKVIIGCMMMIIALPLLQSGFEDQVHHMLVNQITSLEKCMDEDLGYCTNDPQRMGVLKNFVFQFSPFADEWYPEDSALYGDRQRVHTQIYYELIELKMITTNTSAGAIYFNGNQQLRKQSEISSLREWEKITYKAEGNFETRFEAIFSQKAFVRSQCMWQIFQTLFLLLVLVAAVNLLNHDTNEHVILPVQNMLKNVQKLADDPFYVWEDSDQTKTHFVHANEDQESSNDSDSENEWLTLPPEHEIHMLQTTVLKISQLLALGFGRAGWNIIRSAVLKHNTVDTVHSGTKIHGIYMFTDIRNFTNVSECLGKNIIVFVNDVAAVVHDTTAEYDGATNKNIGDAFLAVWTFPRCVTHKNRNVKRCMNNHNYTIDNEIPIELSDLVNKALIATIKIQIRLYRSDKLNRYRVEPAIVKRFKNEFQVKLGAGLHVGWAIEGAIGSNHKIDATYLSPHVNISDQLECKTKLYKSSVIISDHFIRLLPKEALHLVRPVDHVKFKELPEKIDIFTVDLPDHFNMKEAAVDETHDEGIVRKWRKVWTNSVNLYETDADLVDLRKYVDSIHEFKDTYMKGFECYKLGDWDQAERLFKTALTLKEADGPSMELLRFMGTCEGKPPADWMSTGRKWEEI